RGGGDAVGGRSGGRRPRGRPPEPVRGPGDDPLRPRRGRRRTRGGARPPRPPRRPPRRRPRRRRPPRRGLGRRRRPRRRLPRPADGGDGGADAARHAPPLRPRASTEAADVRVEVLALLGRDAALRADGCADAGLHAVAWAAAGAPAGVYLVRLTAGTAVQTQRVTRLH